MWSLDTDGGEDEDWGLSRALAEVSEVEMGRRQSEREDDQEHRFKPGWLVLRRQARRWSDSSNDVSNQMDSVGKC